MWTWEIRRFACLFAYLTQYENEIHLAPNEYLWRPYEVRFVLFGNNIALCYTKYCTLLHFAMEQLRTQKQLS